MSLSATEWSQLLSQLQGLGLRILVVNRSTGEVLVKVPDLTGQ